jgi:hypothetical protein
MIHRTLIPSVCDYWRGWQAIAGGEGELSRGGLVRGAVAQRRFAVGVIARANPRGVLLGYFFGLPRSDVPRLDEATLTCGLVMRS